MFLRILFVQTLIRFLRIYLPWAAERYWHKTGKIFDQKRKMTDLSVFSLISPKYMKSVCITKYMIVLTRYYQKSNADLEKYLVQKTPFYKCLRNLENRLTKLRHMIHFWQICRKPWLLTSWAPYSQTLGQKYFNTFWFSWRFSLTVIPSYDINNYADNSIPCFTEKKNVLLDLEKISDILFKLFTENYLKTNPEKYQVILSLNIELSLKILNLFISCSRCKKLLRIKIDRELSVEPLLEFLCEKESQKLNVLSRLPSSLRFEQGRILLNTFITFQLSYASVVLMFRNRKLDKYINRIHERAFMIVCNNYERWNNYEIFLMTGGYFFINGQDFHDGGSRISWSQVEIFLMARRSSLTGESVRSLSSSRISYLQQRFKILKK